MTRLLAYIDVYEDIVQVIEICGADEIPEVGGSVTFTSGENEGSWHICGVKPLEDGLYDALVFLDARE